MDNTATISEYMESTQRLSKDIKDAARTLGSDEVRFAVDAYYALQENRLRADSQVRSMAGEEPHALLKWLGDQNRLLEGQLKRALQAYAENHEAGAWALSVPGIGPVITAGLLAHIDIEKAPTVGHIYSYAGIQPDSVWLGKEKARQLIQEVKGSEKVPGDAQLIELARRSGRSLESLLSLRVENPKLSWAELQAFLAKRPWNAELKVLQWKAGESFVKVQANKHDIYGKVYVIRKAYEQEKNDNLEYAEQAERILASKNIGKDTDAYKAYSVGKLPPGHIHARAKRYAVKLFLSHLHTAWRFAHFGKMPPNPYSIEILGHTHLVPVPNRELIPGFDEAYREHFADLLVPDQA